MKYKSMVTTTFLMIPLFITSSTSAEIFELVHSYSVDAFDIESGDFDNDGLEDFMVVDFSTSDSSYYEVFLSNGDCSFTRMGVVNIDTTDFGQILTGDFNEDSFDDMLLMNLEETWFYSSDGTGSFTLEEVFPWSYCKGCVGDINNDEHLDYVGISTDSWIFWQAYGFLRVLLGDGLGGFTQGWEYTDPPCFTECQLALLDSVDTDINLDLCAIDYGYGVWTFGGTGDGSFGDPEYCQIAGTGLSGTYACTCGDFDEDGYSDIAVSGSAGLSAPSTFILLNQHDGTFEEQSVGYFIGAGEIRKIATADLDLDWHLDLSLNHEGSIAGCGDGTFNESLSSRPDVDFVFMDMDLDGDLDLADRGARIFRNTTINLGIEGESEGFVTDFILDVTPNPFSSSISIEVSGFSDGSENLQIFDLSGRLICKLESVYSEGQTVFHWNGESSSGVEVSTGIYTARLCSGNAIITATLLKLK